MTEESPLLSDTACAHYLTLLLNRLETIQAACPQRFPLYALGQSNQWISSKGGSWMGGYWLALWFLRAKIKARLGLDNENDCITGKMMAVSLVPKLQCDSAYISMIFYYGAVLPNDWFPGHPVATLKDMSLRALNNLCTHYNKSLKAFPLGQDLGGGETGASTVSVDYLSSLMQFAHYQRCLYQESSKAQHLDGIDPAFSFHLETFLNNGLHQSAAASTLRFTAKGCEKASDTGNWSRGQAWAILGMLRAARTFQSSTYRECAKQMLAYWQCSRQDSIPLNRLNKTKSCFNRDASSLALIAIANQSLAQHYPVNSATYQHYRLEARRQISSLVHSPYVVTNPEYAENSTIFWGANYNTRDGEQLVETPWATFYLAGALAGLLGWVDPEQL